MKLAFMFINCSFDEVFIVAGTSHLSVAISPITCRLRMISVWTSEHHAALEPVRPPIEILSSVCALRDGLM